MLQYQDQIYSVVEEKVNFQVAETWEAEVLAIVLVYSKEKTSGMVMAETVVAAQAAVQGSTDLYYLAYHQTEMIASVVHDYTQVDSSGVVD